MLIGLLSKFTTENENECINTFKSWRCDHRITSASVNITKARDTPAMLLRKVGCAMNFAQDFLCAIHSKSYNILRRVPEDTQFIAQDPQSSLRNIMAGCIMGLRQAINIRCGNSHIWIHNCSKATNIVYPLLVKSWGVKQFFYSLRSKTFVPHFQNRGTTSVNNWTCKLSNVAGSFCPTKFARYPSIWFWVFENKSKDDIRKQNRFTSCYLPVSSMIIGGEHCMWLEVVFPRHTSEWSAIYSFIAQPHNNFGKVL